MLPNLGFVDTGNRFGPASYGTEGIFASVANQIAAMPSLHFGWALLVAIAVIRYSRVRLRWLALVHPILTLLVIVVTVNHYWLDGIVAALLVLLAFGLLALVPPPRAPTGPPSSTSRTRSTAERLPPPDHGSSSGWTIASDQAVLTPDIDGVEPSHSRWRCRPDTTRHGSRRGP